MTGLSLSLALLLAVVVWAVLRDDRYVAPPPEAPSPVRVDPAGAGRTLSLLVEAVEERDPARAADLAPDEDRVAARLLAAVVANAGRLRVRDFTLRYVAPDGPATPDGTWTATVDTTWRFAGFDRAPADTEVRFGFRAEDDAVALVSVGGGDQRSPLWLTGPVEVRRNVRTLVLGSDGAAVDRYARLAAGAVPVVRRVLPAWRPRLVVEVPPSPDALDRALGADPGTYAGIAAVTASVDGSVAPGAPVHVLVNPVELGNLRRVGAQVVLSHEAVHVATDAGTSRAPLWLLEGFADYVALRDVPLPVTTTAAQVVREVRRDGVPGALPGEAEFERAGSHLGAVYEGAWLACTVLAERAGERALVDLYRAVGRGEDLDRALRRHTGLAEADLVRAWQARLRDLAA